MCVQKLEASVPRAQWSAGGRNIKLPSLTPADVVIKALYGLTGMLLLGALIAVTLVRSAPAPSAQPAMVDSEGVVLEEAA